MISSTSIHRVRSILCKNGASNIHFDFDKKSGRNIVSISYNKSTGDGILTTYSDSFISDISLENAFAMLINKSANYN